jgi:catechol 2,3-dioxygenase-like lactoylglutathione lyase family enzyme
MFANTKAYSGLAVNDLQAAREFYGETLGLRTSGEYGLMWLHLAGGRDTLVYQQPDATPASYTILNFEVDDIDEAVDALAARGVTFQRYDNAEQDDKGVFRKEGPYIAWFKDPSGNVLSSSKSGRRPGPLIIARDVLLSVPLAAGAVALLLGPVTIRAERWPPYRSRPGSISCFRRHAADR